MSKKVSQQKKVNHNFEIDCTKPVEDKVFNTNNFAEFLRGRIKINGKFGNLGEHILISSYASRVSISASVPLSKRYLKYLTKKYLKKHSLREFLYVIATGKHGYQIKYFNIQQEGVEEQ